ncbi:hypothetical protein ACIF6K_31555 [Streptomyces sp. NPDC085942]|uniref:hypothetical protein n=1 Tax=Streptomyces sp. NPDC085942 TaxID=3365743 RepID=UPI0037D65272
MTDLVTLAGAIEDVDALGKQINNLLMTTVMSVMVTAAVIVTWRATKSVIAAGVAFLGGVALWFVVMNAPAFRDSVGDNLKPSAAAAPVAGAGESGGFGAGGLGPGGGR